MSLRQSDRGATLPRWARALGVLLLVLTLLYAVPIEGVVLLWFVLALLGFLVYLFYRLVLAVERLARASERMAADRPRD